ncbi:MAG: DUF4177 domain-containing protein, partial [Ktedonobacterales bacterium]|nr:DUF4177 domain-containing protein [Ktedonobacterales bacterium]
EYARQGWRLVQIFVAQPATVTSEFVLILERPQNEDERMKAP